jgi:VWFA-related protein
VRGGLVAAVPILLAGAAVLAGQEAAPPPRADEAPPVFAASTQRVVLDVVARDRKGRVVRDLRPDEIEVYEDGVRKVVTAVRFVEAPSAPAVAPGAAAAAPFPSPPTPADAVRTPTLVSLVFDSLDAEGRAFARKAALDLVDLQDRPDVFVAVFFVGHRLSLLQQFTTERAALREAVDRACGMLDAKGVAPDDAALGRAEEEVRRAAAVNDAAAAGAASGGGAAAGQAASQSAFAEVELRILRMAQELQRDQSGNASLYSLFALARQQQRLAGRKAIFYFSEGLEVPPHLEATFRSVVSEANRANLSIYSVDARGLRAGSDFDQARSDLRRATEYSRRQTLSRGGRAVRREDVMAAEMAEGAINLNVQGMLGALSDETGGRLVANTNDVRPALEQAMADMSGYYEVAYDPQLAEYDGRFRRIEVKVARDGVRVQTRSGYFALPPGEGTVNFPWELPLARALAAKPAPRDLEYHATAYHFGSEGDEVRHTLVTEVPLAALTFEGGGGTRRAHFSLMALVRDAGGHVVERYSRDSPVEVQAKDLDALRRGDAVFTRSFLLPPGRYHLEVVVYDQNAKKAGVRKSVLLVSPARPGLSLSSLAVVKRTEPVAVGALASSDPLRVGSNRVVPMVAEPTFHPGEAVSLYLVVFAPPGTTTPPGLTLEFEREGHVVGRSSVTLPAPDALGQIPYIASIPSGSLGPGRYQVSAVVDEAGTTSAREQTFFTVAAD